MTEETKQRHDSESLLPIEIEQRISIEDEAALLGKRKGRPIGVYAGITGFVLLAGLVAFGQFDEQPAQAAAAMAVDAELGAALTAFNGCAFSGTPEQQLQLAPDVQLAAENFGTRYGRGYAQRLRKCIPKLDRLAATLDNTPVAAELKPALTSVTAATVKLAKAWTAYRDYLEQGRFEPAAAAPRTEAIGQAVVTLTEGRQQLATAGGVSSAQ